MSNLQIPFYNIDKPSLGEIVLVVFTEKKDETTHFEGNLVEYNCKLFMNFADSTKKRRANFNKIVSLNKETFASVDEILDDNIIKVSLRDVDKDHAVEDNKTLIKIFKDLSRKISKDINDLWKQVVYKLDEKRREEDIESSLLNYCIEEKEFLTSLFPEANELYELIDKYRKEKPYKIISKVEIVSTGEIGNTVTIIKKCLDNIKFPYTFKYETAPNYILESMSTESKVEEHDTFIELLKQEGLKMNPKTFVKCERK